MAESSHPKVLIIEDERTIIKALDMEMNNRYNLVEALDGETGLNLARNEKPDLIILDLILPKMHGFEVLKNLKSDNETKNVPVIILTCLGQDSDKKKGMALGADDYLIKTDYRLEEVAEKIDHALNKNNK